MSDGCATCKGLPRFIEGDKFEGWERFGDRLKCSACGREPIQVVQEVITDPVELEALRRSYVARGL